MLKSRRFLLGVAVSVLFIGLFLYRSDSGKTWHALITAEYSFVVPCVALYFLSMWWRALRWRFILQPIGDFRTSRLWPALLVGYAVNNLLPVRVGDFTRAYYLGKREGVSASSVMGTLLVERVFDVLALVSLVVIVLPFLPVTGLLRNLLQWDQPGWLALVFGLSMPFLLLVIVIAAFTAFPAPTVQLLTRLSRCLPARFQGPVVNVLVRFGAGFTALRNPRSMGLIYLLSIPIWVLESLVYLILAFGFDIHTFFGHWLDLTGAMVLLTAVPHLGTAISTTGGGIGAFEFLVQGTLIFFRVAANVASAYAIIVHAVFLIPATILGLVYLWTGQLSLNRLARAHAEGKQPPAARNQR